MILGVQRTDALESFGATSLSASNHLPAIDVQAGAAALCETCRSCSLVGRCGGGLLLYGGVLLTGVYGGYFGAAQGVLLIAVMGLLLDEELQRINAAKNVLAGLVNLVAAIVFIAVTDVAWQAAGLIAAGSVVGGQLGAFLGRRIPPAVLRGIIVVVGVAAIVKILTD